MTEDDFPDTRLTFLILQDATLFGNSDKLKSYDLSLVYATRDRLINEGYVRISRTGAKHPETGIRRDVSKLTSRGSELFQQLQGKWRD